MNRSKLIVRRMKEWEPFTIGRKNRYTEPNSRMFAGWSQQNRNSWTSAEKANDDAEADRAEAFLRRNPLGLLFAAQLDQGKPAWKAWRGPYRVAQDLGWKNMTAPGVVATHLYTLVASLKRCKLGCRNLNHYKAAINLRELAAQVVCDYQGDARRLWTTPTSFQELAGNTYGIPGIGVGIGNMMIIIFVRYGMVPQIAKTKEVLSTLQLKADTHVKHVFYRTGLAKNKTERAVMAAAARFAPDLPAALDLAGFDIGRLFCHKSSPNCSECPVAYRSNGESLCPRVGLRLQPSA